MGPREILGLLSLVHVCSFVWTGGGVGWRAGIMSGHSGARKGGERVEEGFGIGGLGCAMQWVVLQFLAVGFGA